MEQKLTWTTAEVCRQLGLSDETFRLKREELERAGFPRKLPGINAYAIAAVTDWVAHSGGRYTPFAERRPTIAGPQLTIAARLADELDAEYGGREAA